MASCVEIPDVWTVDNGCLLYLGWASLKLLRPVILFSISPLKNPIDKEDLW